MPRPQFSISVRRSLSFSSLVAISLTIRSVGFSWPRCEAVGLGGEVVGVDVDQFLGSSDDMFDLVFVDPPYADADDAVAASMAKLADRVAAEGIIVLIPVVGATLKKKESLVLVDERRYGGAQLWRFQKEST